MKYLYIILIAFYMLVDKANAQFFIVDDIIRTELKKQYPQCFDAQNLLDTNCSAIVNASKVALDFDKLGYREYYCSGWDDSMFVDGLQFFKMADTLILNYPCNLDIYKQHLPPQLKVAHIFSNVYREQIGDMEPTTIRIFSLPETVTELAIKGSFYDNAEYGWSDFDHFVSARSLPVGIKKLNIGYQSGLTFTTLPAGLESFTWYAPTGARYVLNSALEELILTDVGSAGGSYTPGSASILPTGLKSFVLSNSRFDNSSSGVFPSAAFFNDLQIPSGLRSLSLLGSQTINHIISLPSNLKKLEVADTKVNFSSLPTGLDTLILRRGGLEFEQMGLDLSPNLKYLELNRVNLQGIPPLPATLLHLNVTLNFNIAQVPSQWPSGLRYLHLGNNRITAIPLLPGQLQTLDVSWNTDLACLPSLPPQLEILNTSRTAISCIPNETETIKATAQLPICSVPCGQVARYARGRVFLDVNENATYEPGIDRALRNMLLRLQPSGIQTVTDGDGNYEVLLQADTINTLTLLANRPHLKSVSPASHTFSDMSGDENGKNFAVVLQDVQDVEVYLAATAARPGFEYICHATVINSGNIQPESIRVVVKKPADWENLLTIPAATLITQDSIVWENVQIPLGQSSMFTFRARLPETAEILGDPYAIVATVTPKVNDATPANNTAEIIDIIIGSYDPNDKLVNISTIPPGYPADQELVYTIRFQNTGTDTAFTVVIKDTVLGNLKPESVRVLGASHNYVFSMDGSTAVFTFDNILLPDSNTNEPGSHGFVMLALKAKAGLSAGQKFENRAAIFFDFNEAIITNTATTEIKLVSNVLGQALANVLVFPNPTRHSIKVMWQEVGQAILSLYDLSGKYLQRQVVSTSFANLDVSDYPSGMYLLQVNVNGLTGVFKVQVTK